MTNRLPAVPLITCDPFFSIWSPCDNLYDGDTCNWTGVKAPMKGLISVDGTKYRFMGSGSENAATQTDFSITPTSSIYSFNVGSVSLKVKFTTPLLLHDLSLTSRPVSYISFEVLSQDKKEHKTEITVIMDEKHCYEGDKRCDMRGGEYALENGNAAFMGKCRQTPLGQSGDAITIDWGFLYLAGDARIKFGRTKRYTLSATLALTASEQKNSGFIVAAYDDIASIQYFGDTLTGYWTKDGDTIVDVIEKGIADYRSIISQCEVFDNSLLKWADEIGGKEYALLVSASYRQSIAAHKLVADKNGDPLFISKECYSNGCAATADVSYPSIPLYLIYNPELVKGMLRPIFRFAKSPCWKYDFAPHDAGRYPYVWGQVYSLKEGFGAHERDAHLPFYNFPKSADVYNIEYQMPIEECGNMLVMSAAAAICSDNADFLADEMPLLEKWVSYLVEFGSDPANQLCTDDFGGHLAHNANLAAKAIMGIASFSLILAMQSDWNRSEQYMTKAKEMATEWSKKADAGDHTVLSFGDKDSWSLKYNLVWDLIFKTELFADEIYSREIKWYKKQSNDYGVPLDNRKFYTKSDWILWVTAFADNKADMSALIAPIAKFLNETPNRTPFTDWYLTNNGEQVGFQNRTVQGGLFMPLLKDYLS